MFKYSRFTLNVILITVIYFVFHSLRIIYLIVKNIKLKKREYMSAK